MCHTYDWIYYFKLPFRVYIVEAHKDGQLRKQSWEAMSSVALNSGIFKRASAITHDFLGAQLKIESHVQPPGR